MKTHKIAGWTIMWLALVSVGFLAFILFRSKSLNLPREITIHNQYIEVDKFFQTTLSLDPGGTATVMGYSSSYLFHSMGKPEQRMYLWSYHQNQGLLRLESIEHLDDETVLLPIFSIYIESVLLVNGGSRNLRNELPVDAISLKWD
jgi:hypothetical protein